MVALLLGISSRLCFFVACNPPEKKKEKKDRVKEKLEEGDKNKLLEGVELMPLDKIYYGSPPSTGAL